MVGEAVASAHTSAHAMKPAAQISSAISRTRLIDLVQAEEVCIDFARAELQLAQKSITILDPHVGETSRDMRIWPGALGWLCTIAHGIIWIPYIDKISTFFVFN